MPEFRRGQLWVYKPVIERQGQSLLRLIMSADGLNSSSTPLLIGLPVFDSDPGTLLSVAIEGQGWAVVTSIEPIMRRRLSDLAGVASMEEMQQIEQAIKAALDLPD